MLWRTPYSTTHLDASDLACPSGVFLTGDSWDPSGVFCFAIALTEEGIRNLGVWRRLFDSEPGLVGYVGYVRVNLSEQIWKEIPDMTPPSAWSRTILVNQLSLQMLELVGDYKIVGLVCDGGAVILAVAGPPTEDAWEEFCELANQSQAKNLS